MLLTMILAAKSSLANWNYVPSGSMEPNLLVGDMIWVNHVAYDLRVPFSGQVLAHRADPLRGDIVVARSLDDGSRIVKRVVGIPGDTIAIYDQLLMVNDEPLELQLLDDQLVLSSEPGRPHAQVRETILDRQRTVLVNRQPPPTANKRLRLGPDEYFLMGDHRDNSLDSRHWGPMPRQRIIGRATHVVASVDYHGNWLPRTDRFLQPLD